MLLACVIFTWYFDTGQPVLFFPREDYLYCSQLFSVAYSYLFRLKAFSCVVWHAHCVVLAWVMSVRLYRYSYDLTGRNNLPDPLSLTVFLLLL